MRIRVKNLRLRPVIGVYDWERKIRQDVVVNLTIDFDGDEAAATDDVEKTLDYERITQRVIAEVENSSFQLLESLAAHILRVVMEEPKARFARVEVDKPGALRFADSVSVVVEGHGAGAVA